MTDAGPSRRHTLPVRILATGSYEPSTLVTSQELDARFDRAPGESLARSGVASRRWASPEETSSRMATAAVREALERAGLGVDDLDALIVSAVSPEQPMPTTAVLTLAALGATGGAAEGFDVNTSCVGFLTGLRAGAAGIATGQWSRVAVVATEIASKGLNHDSVEASALFGDGAGAVVLGRADDTGTDADTGTGTEAAAPPAVLASRVALWPEAAGACRIDAGGTRLNVVTPPDDLDSYLFTMDGAILLRHVAKNLPAFLDGVLAEAGVTLEDIDVVVPHQASGVGMRYLVERVAPHPERVVDILRDHGNQVSASIPVALDHAVTTGRLRRGDLVLLAGTGAGLSLAAAVLRY
ncbi:MAG: ketoacyl-ACP synthase III [Salana multivorans]|uniref:3-oxoacyl-ACP synthase III family protein n=1 Tax=Salana multivorans TaxID=120377 RepID=UPI00095F770D|nr:ketoacyl-ACP synthase III [Salana multivorans]MBN8881340.1 ketoacyl-ACP synthase III [Salana multivorans]OJX96099.1 MAG: hypothetical protein BGO96_07410 [Micrococcales bacterium 73-15]